ncbi:hypothetical protein GCM10022205_07420 [Spinactinospora alkalitolerans]
MPETRLPGSDRGRREPIDIVLVTWDVVGLLVLIGGQSTETVLGRVPSEAFPPHHADGAGLHPGWVSDLYTRLVTEPTYRTAAVVVLAQPSAHMCNGLG